MDKLAEANRMIWQYRQTELRESRLKRAEDMILRCKGKLLDIACSKGEFTSRFLNKGIDVYGIDLGINRIKAAKDNGLKAVVSDISAGFPFKDEEFDILFAGEILEHMVDTDQFILEAKRVLKKTGKFIITTPNLISLENRMRILFGRYPIWVDYSLRLSGHVRCYTPKVLKYQLKTHGFKIVRHTGNWVPFIPQMYIDDIKLPVLAITGRIFPNLAMDIIIEAEKV